MAIVYYDPDSGLPMYDDGQGGYTPVEPSRYRNQGNQVIYGYEPTNDGQNPLYGDPYGPEVTEYLNRLGGPRALAQAGFTEEEFRKDPWNIGGKTWHALSGEGGGMSLLESLKTAATSDVAKLVGMGLGIGNIGNFINSGGLGSLLGGGETALSGASNGLTPLQQALAGAEVANNPLISIPGNASPLSQVLSGSNAMLGTTGVTAASNLANLGLEGVGGNLPMPPGTPPPAPVDIPGGLPGMPPTPPLPGQTGPTLPTIPGGTGTVINGIPPVAAGGAAAGGFSSFLKDVLGISNEANIPRSLIDLLGGVYSAYSQNQTAGDYENFTKSYLDRAFPQATTDEQIGWAGVSKDMRTNGDFWKNNSLMNQLGQTAANKAERQAAAQGYNLSSNALQSMYRDSYDAMASKFALPYMEQVSRNAGLQKASPDAFASSMASNIYKNDQQTQGTIGNVIKTGVNTILGKP